MNSGVLQKQSASESTHYFLTHADLVSNHKSLAHSVIRGTALEKGTIISLVTENYREKVASLLPPNKPSPIQIYTFALTLKSKSILCGNVYKEENQRRVPHSPSKKEFCKKAAIIKMFFVVEIVQGWFELNGICLSLQISIWLSAFQNRDRFKPVFKCFAGLDPLYIRQS